MATEDAQAPDPVPAWSLPGDTAERIALPSAWPARVTRDWAWRRRQRARCPVCILDSGVEAGHPLVGSISRAVAVSRDGDTVVVGEDSEGDLCGHGTACAGIVRAIAPECEIFSVRVLGAGYTGSGPILLEGLRWAVDQGYHVINMSLSTTKSQFAGMLHDLADSAYFRRTVVVASAHNMPVESYPWRFAAVISVGSHEKPDPLTYYYNPDPPVEFFARGIGVDVPWFGGGSIRASGNSFATPHITGICARILGEHPGLTPFQLKNILYLTASNVGGT